MTVPGHPELRAALEALAAEPAEPARRTAVLELLLSGSLLAIAVEDGEPTILCFTDEEAFGRMPAPAPPAAVRLPELWASLAALGLTSATINPGGPVTVTLHEGELAALAEGRVAQDGDARVLFVPVEPVPEAGAAAAAAVQPHPEILAAYLLEAAPGDGERRLVAALRLAPGLTEEHAARVVAAVAAGLTGASVVAASAWEAELIAGSQVEPVFARRSA